MIEIAAQLSRYEPGLRMAPHADGCRRLSIVIGGTQTETAGRRTALAAVGSVAIKAPESEHHNDFGATGATILSVLLNDSLVGALGLPSDTLSAWRWVNTGSVTVLGLGLAVALRGGDGRLAGRRLCALLEHFKHTRDGARPEDARAQRVAEKIAQAPHDETPSVSRLAEGERLHPASLDRLFRRTHGCAITTFRQRERVRSAARCLLDGDTPLVGIAMEHGFSDLSHMSRIFRREVGVAPGRFRDVLREQPRRLDPFKTEWQLTA